jgi:hypothetical protein
MPKKASSRPSQPQGSKSPNSAERRKTYRELSREPVTIERLDRCIKIVAGWIVQHNIPEAIHALKRMEAERDRLLREGDAIDYAKKVLARSGEDTSK